MSNAADKKKSKPTLSIVGSGRLGTALAIALASAGYRTDAVVARRPARARKSAALIGGAAKALASTELHLLPLSKIILISTPDDEIISTAQGLALAQRNKVKGRTVLHTSGALSSDVLAPLAAFGFHVGSLHPLVSVSDPRTGPTSLHGAFFCVEGDDGATRTARAIVRDLKGRSFSIGARYKPLYHAAAVMASGHLVALFDLAVDMLAQCGLDRRKAQQVLRPLLESTVANLLSADPASALTGPFVRGDLATVQRHLSALGEPRFQVALDAYRALAVHTVELSKKEGADQQMLNKISKALQDSSVSSN